MNPLSRRPQIPLSRNNIPPNPLSSMSNKKREMYVSPIHIANINETLNTERRANFLRKNLSLKRRQQNESVEKTEYESMECLEEYASNNSNQEVFINDKYHQKILFLYNKYMGNEYGNLLPSPFTTIFFKFYKSITGDQIIEGQQRIGKKRLNMDDITKDNVHDYLDHEYPIFYIGGIYSNKKNVGFKDTASYKSGFIYGKAKITDITFELFQFDKCGKVCGVNNSNPPIIKEHHVKNIEIQLTDAYGYKKPPIIYRHTNDPSWLISTGTPRGKQLNLWPTEKIDNELLTGEFINLAYNKVLYTRKLIKDLNLHIALPLYSENLLTNVDYNKNLYVPRKVASSRGDYYTHRHPVLEIQDIYPDTESNFHTIPNVERERLRAYGYGGSNKSRIRRNKRSRKNIKKRITHRRKK